MSLSDRVHALIYDALGEIQKEINSLEHLRDVAKQGYTKEVENLKLVQQDAENVKKDIDREYKILESSRKLLQADIEKVKGLEEKEALMEAETKRFNQEIAEKKSVLSTLVDSINRASQDIVQLDKIKKELAGSTETLNKTNEEISEKSRTIAALESDIETLIRKKDIAVLEADKAYGERAEQIEKTLKEVQDREKEVTVRERNVAQKENDLITVEKRWRKIYETRGASFKI